MKSLEDCECRRLTCFWEGRHYEDGASWDTDPCTVCTCRRGKPECSLGRDRPHCLGESTQSTHSPVVFLHSSCLFVGSLTNINAIWTGSKLGWVWKPVCLNHCKKSKLCKEVLTCKYLHHTSRVRHVYTLAPGEAPASPLASSDLHPRNCGRGS